ncbi:MFS transporter [Roseococcus sp. YIM B11640]|uniref:MFS transporter n=1 Tax=Roseococcus sp. YIM B11640 TaxID=3133973 RepID=UPI003C79A73A
MRSPFHSLLGGAAGIHAADQLAMAALPLNTVLLLGAGPGMVGMLLAAQAGAWLLGSLPAGLVVDGMTRRGALLLAAALSIAGCGIATLATEPGLLGLGTFIGSLGTVLFVLAAGSAVPDLVARDGLARANAQLELCRASVTLLAAPTVGALASLGWLRAAYGAAMLSGLLALAAISLLPRTAAPARSTRPDLLEGAGFVWRQELLRAIGFCAVFWNTGFFALTAGFVPFALDRLALDPARIGIAQGGYGAGLLAGAAAAPWFMRRCGLNAVLLAGPGLSALAPLLLLAAPAGGTATPLLAQFLVGFGPMMWFVCQVSIRQSVTPREMLGRVGASLQVAIYGVRPLGALAGGWLASRDPAWAMVLAAALFIASTLVVPLSALIRLRRLPSPA